MNEEHVAITIENLSKKFAIGAPPPPTLREAIIRKIKLRGRFAPKREFWALKDISLNINKGQSVGIIGNNGAGKSTLLKLLSRITRPTTGRIVIEGRVSSLLEVGTGFHPELTGKENIYLNGAILGMSRKEISSKLEDIIEFSGVEEFVNSPVKHFSSGMKVRLAFSVAAHLNPDILIVDEVLAVGDAEFQKKCLGVMGDVAHSGRTVIFVSHNMGAISQLCNRTIVLKEGRVTFDGHTEEAIKTYSDIQDQLAVYEHPYEGNQNRLFHVKRVSLLNDDKVANSFAHDQPIDIEIKFLALKYLRGLNICISVYNYLQNPVFTSDVSLTEYKTGSNTARVTIPSHTLKSGNYSFLVAIHDPQRGAGALEFLQYICPMTVYDNGSEFSKYQDIWQTGDVFVDCQWEFSGKE